MIRALLLLRAIAYASAQAQEIPAYLGGLPVGGHWVACVATAYCPCTLCCGARACGVTADGTKCSRRPYGLAADPARLPFGSRVLIPPGQGYLDGSCPDDRVYVVDDTGQAIVRESRGYSGVRIDLRYRTHAAALAFGRKTIEVYILPQEMIQ